MRNKNQHQHIAASPAHSVWVSASAGTGKTKVLTDRVLRLLLAGAKPDKILCLTFTNAAASEMKSRITKALIEWKDDPSKIEATIGSKPTALQLKRAKNLFADQLFAPEQVSIHTIHSFAQQILQRFPFEAGLEPGFRILSDIETRELSQRVIGDISNELQEGSELIKDFSYVISNTHELTFSDLILEIIASQMNFRDLFHMHDSAESYEDYLKSKTGVHDSADDYLSTITSSLNALSENEFDIVQKYNSYIKLSQSEKIKNFAEVKILFCTEKDEPRKSLLNKKSSEAYPDLERVLREIQARIVEYNQKINTARMIEDSGLMFKIAKFVISKYQRYKKQLVSLDYDDLIYYAKELLSNNGLKDWVLYKLDGGIDHLLIDEAQDTSPAQWQITMAIMREFYAGEGASKENRTVFIVGDEKQSIYSFQGADISNFAKVNRFIKEQMHMAEKKYQDIALEASYRSAKPILDIVSRIFSKSHFQYPALECAREGSPGLVELWPLCVDESEPKELFWPFIEELESSESSSKILSDKIAQFIKNYIDSKTVLPSTGKTATPGDFMILIRNRNQFTHEIIDALKERDVPVAGIDRMLILDNLSVLDVMSAAKFCLLPEDDLNLAALLKSPIIGIDELAFRNIAMGRTGALITAIKDPQIIAILGHLQAMAAYSSAFDFFHNLIDVMGVRQILVAANGESAHDALDELLNLASQHAHEQNNSLQSFVYWLEKNDIEVKRDVGALGSVKVMTAHGAKGLQAPIVILPDTTSSLRNGSNFLWRDSVFLWLKNSKNNNKFYQGIKNRADEDGYEEYIRLLYVAMTRAEDHLVICGFSSSIKPNERCWYNLVAEVMRSEGDNGIVYYGDLAVEAASFRGAEPRGNPRDLGEASSSYRLLPCPVGPRNEIAPVFKNAKSPLDLRLDISYGVVVHKILEDSVKTKNFTFSPAHPFIKMLPLKLQNHVLAKLPKLFATHDFKALLAYPVVKTEVSIGNKENGATKLGRIDLLAMSDTDMVIVDYKTESAPPSDATEVDARYIEQLKFYASAMQKIMPNHKITTKILWLENLHLMDIPR